MNFENSNEGCSSASAKSVVAYIAYFWRQMDKRSLTTEELNQSEKY
ncbi:MAG: hypothetical protein IIX12_04970 [Alistipes sp.]|nr:hypothetical protein [Alistipes sp.]MBR0330931.1 hypothetical protein [Alistipes sp.]